MLRPANAQCIRPLSTFSNTCTILLSVFAPCPYRLQLPASADRAPARERQLSLARLGWRKE